MKKLFPALLFGALITCCQTQDLSLTEVEWKLVRLNNTDYATLTPPVTLTLSDENKVAGFAGCNRYFGLYIKKDADLNFSGLGSTKMYCQEKMEVEDAFLKAMGEVNRYEITGKKLTLQKDESVLMEFSR